MREALGKAECRLGSSNATHHRAVLLVHLSLRGAVTKDPSHAQLKEQRNSAAYWNAANEQTAKRWGSWLDPQAWKKSAVSAATAVGKFAESPIGQTAQFIATRGASGSFQPIGAIKQDLEFLSAVGSAVAHADLGALSPNRDLLTRWEGSVEENLAAGTKEGDRQYNGQLAVATEVATMGAGKLVEGVVALRRARTITAADELLPPGVAEEAVEAVTQARRRVEAAKAKYGDSGGPNGIVAMARNSVDDAISKGLLLDDSPLTDHLRILEEMHSGSVPETLEEAVALIDDSLDEHGLGWVLNQGGDNASRIPDGMRYDQFGGHTEVTEWGDITIFNLDEDILLHLPGGG